MGVALSFIIFDDDDDMGPFGGDHTLFIMMMSCPSLVMSPS